MPRLHSGLVALFLAVCVAWGAFVRTWNLGGRPFWCDEAWVATLLRDLSPAQLLRQTDTPLPPLFALAADWIGHRFGPPEMAWRLLPAACGVLVVPLAYLLARTLRAPRSLALAVTGLCASSLSLVIWSRELKHCSVEALVSVLAALLVFQTRRSAGGPRRWALGAALAALALVAPWVAHGALLPLGTLIPVLFLRKPVPGSRRGVAVIGAVSAAALLIGGSTVWHLAARAQAGQPALVRYASIWAIRPLDPESWRMPLGSFASATTRLFCPPGWFRPEQTQRGDIALAAAALVIWTVAVLGLWAWPRHGRRELTWWLLAPPLAMLAASVVFHYPFGCARMMQFWAPPMVIAVCAGLVTLWRSLLVFVCRRGAPALLSGILAGALPAAVVFQHARQHCHYYYHDFPTVLRTLNDQRARGEPVFVELLAAPSVRYYAPELAAPIIFTPIAIGVLAPETVDVRPLVESLLRHATRRIWIVATDEGPGLTDRPALSAIQRAGYSLRVVQRAGGLTGSEGAAQLVLATRR